MHIKSVASTQKENKQEDTHKKKVAKGVKFSVSVGDSRKCPECRSRLARVVWVSENHKTMGVKCPANHHAARTVGFKYTPTMVPSIKARENLVFLTAAI